MSTLQFVGEWAIRSSLLVVGGALLLRVLHVKDSSVRLAAWTGLLCGSLAIPLLTVAVPQWSMPVALTASPALPESVASFAALPVPTQTVMPPVSITPGVGWRESLIACYWLVAGGLLLRLFIGLLLARNLRRSSRATGLVVENVDVRESDAITAPVTLGALRPSVLLPADWRDWTAMKLNAVLAHEGSHIRRRDPAVQLLSALHRAILWHSPLSWVLHRQLVHLAEEASDDAAVAACDRTSYAEVLLHFMSRGVRGAYWQGVAMARYGQPESRIHRILDGRILSAGLTRWSVTAILVLGMPLAYIAAAADPKPASKPRPDKAGASARTSAASGASDPLGAVRNTDTIRRYRIYLGTTRSGSWDSRDPVDDDALRARYGDKFAWFRQAGGEYVVTDEAVMAQIQQAMEPQNKVNQMQNGVNARQSVVNEMQSKVNILQDQINDLQNKVNRRQDLVNRVQDSANRADNEALIRRLEEAARELKALGPGGSQEAVNRRQDEVNQEQNRVNEEQQKVNLLQNNVNQEQNRVSELYRTRIQEIFDSALENGLARRLN